MSSLRPLIACLILAGCPLHGLQAVAGGSSAPTEEPTHRTLNGLWTSVTPGMDASLFLTQCADGGLIGYLPGSPGSSLLGGSVTGGAVNLTIYGEDATGFWTLTFTGSLQGTTLSGTLDLGGSIQPLDLQKTNLDLVEEHWTLFHEDGENGLELARVEDRFGNFMEAGFVGQHSCDFAACGGQIETWTISGSTHTLTTAADNPCDSVTVLTGDLDPAAMLMKGSYVTTDCTSILDSGNIIGGKGGLTRRGHIQGVLRSLARFIDDFEDEDLAALDVLHSTYLHDGKSRTDWQSDFQAWWASYEDVQVDVSIKALYTFDDSEVHPYLGDYPRMNWALSASGRSVSTGLTEIFWSYQPDFPDGMHLYFLGQEAGRWVILGNGESAPFGMELPITYATYDSTNGGVWPFGVHAGGHPEGHPGLDFFYTAGSKVLAAADGEVIAILPNESHRPSVLDSVMQEVRMGVRLIYDEVENKEAWVVVGAVLTPGDVLGDPLDKGTVQSCHFGVRSGGQHIPPADYWSATAQPTWDLMWPEASYFNELIEPLQTNPVDNTFPISRRWSRTTSGAGSSTAHVDLSLDGSDDSIYDYSFLDASLTVTEWGTVNFNYGYPMGSITFEPDASLGLSKRFGVVDIVGETMWLDWDTTTPPTGLAGASVYSTTP